MATISPDTTPVEVPSSERPLPVLRNVDFARLWLAFLLRLAWRARSAWLGLAAVALALFAQSISEAGRIDDGFRLYLAACALFVVAFLFTYRAHRYARAGSYVAPEQPAVISSLRVRRASSVPALVAATQLRARWTRLPLLAVGRVLLVAIATLISIVAAVALAGVNIDAPGMHLDLKGDEFNRLAMLGWAAACLLLVIACARQRHELWPLAAANLDELKPGNDVPSGATMQRSRTELLILAAILLVAAALRFYKVEFTPMGLSLDEGDIGLFAQLVAKGDFSQVPPLGAVSWYQLPSMVPMSEALGLKLFGLNSALGLRLPTVIAGILVVFVFYQLLRLMFGPRTALLGAALIAIGNEQLRFSQSGQGGESMALFWLISFYFVAKGLRSKRYLDFAWAGLAAGFSLYFYPSSKLIIPLLAAFFAYLTLSRLRFIRDYWSHLLVCAVAAFIISAPLNLYTYNNQGSALYRLQEVSVLSDQNAAGYFAAAGLPYTPTGKVSLAGILQNWDGWKVVLPKQAMLTYRAVNLIPEYPNGKYSYYQSGHPLLPPQEAVIVILGLAYALWRWRDPRYMMFNIWFWLGFFVSVALTILTPDYQRVSGVDISMYAFAAFALTQLAAAIERAWRDYYPHMRDWLRQQTARLRQRAANMRPLPRRVTLRTRPAAFALSGGHRYLNLALVGVIAVYAFQNLYIYYNDYNAATCPWSEYNAPGYYIRDNLGPSYHVYFAGWPNEQFSPQITAFLFADKVETENLYNPYDIVPVHEVMTKSIAFLFYENHADFIAGFRQFYPEGSDNQLKVPCNSVGLHSFTIPASLIAARQRLNLRYDFGGSGGPTSINMTTDTLGFSGGSAPADLNYPAVATWYSGLYAPQYGRYRFHISAANLKDAAKGGNATLFLDNRPWLALPSGTVAGTVDLVMAEGWHALAVKAALPDAAQRVRLVWQQPGGPPNSAIPSQYLWSGPLSNRPFGLTGELTTDGDHKVAQRKLLTQPSGGDERQQLHVPNLSTTLVWRGTLTPPVAGNYTINIFSYAGSATATLDGQELPSASVNNGDQGYAYSANLEARPYNLNLTHLIGYNQFTELYLTWTRPDGMTEQIPPAALRPARSVYTLAEIGDLSQLPPAQALPSAAALKPSLLINTDKGGAPSQPSAVGVDSSGNIYVGDTANKRVLKYDPQGKLLTSWAVLPDGPGGPSTLIDLQVMPNGNVVVMDVTNKNIQIYDPNGNYLYNVDTGNRYATYAPNGLAVDQVGNIYVANTGGSNIYKLSQKDEMLGSFGLDQSLTPDQQLDQPIDLVVDEYGNMYVCDLKNRLIEYDPQGRYVRQWALSSGVGKLAYYKGIIYIAATGANVIYSLNTADDSVATYGGAGSDPGQFSRPSAIAVDANGNLYVSDQNNHRVQVIPNPNQ